MAEGKTFEEKMTRLEEIVQTLEKGEASLDESMKLFTEGTRLSQNLGAMLDKAEQTVTVLTESAEGELSEQPFAAEE